MLKTVGLRIAPCGTTANFRSTNPHLGGSPCEERLYSVVQVVGNARLFEKEGYKEGLRAT